tara:strand:+ start:1215 stop:2225 length:1011 start_codon:yes stop_codon:yes gene_type:complete
MDDKYFLNFQKLMKKITEGEIPIHEPIDIHNKRLDTLSKISFLTHLLSYRNINKDNILEILFQIYNMFQNRIEALKQNDTIQVMFERINNEWYEPENLYIIQLPITNKFFDQSKYVKSKYLKSYELCNHIDNLCKIDTNVSFNSDQLSHPLKEHLETGTLNCEGTIQEINTILKDVEAVLKYLKEFNLNQFIDLSIKHKSLYLQLNDKEDDDIPQNIHIIFSNFIHIHNLLYKQMVHYHKHMLSVLNNVDTKCKKMHDMKNNIDSIAFMRSSQVKEHMEDQQDDNLLNIIRSQDDSDVEINLEDDDENDIYVEGGKFVTKNNNPNQEKQKSFLSFF